MTRHTVFIPTLVGYARRISPNYCMHEEARRNAAFTRLCTLGCQVISTTCTDNGYLFEYNKNPSYDADSSAQTLRDDGFTTQLLHGRTVVFLPYSSPYRFILAEKCRNSYISLLYGFLAVLFLLISVVIVGKEREMW